MTAAERFVKRMLGGVFGDKPSEVVEKRGLGEEHGDEEQKNWQADNQKVDEKPAKTAQDSLYEALVADESPKDKTLAEHDKERHPNGFNPETDSCKFREELKKETETDKGDEVDVDRGREEGIEVDGEGNGKNPLVSAEEDAEYLEAVKKGDMETAAKMVREVAGRAFPNTKVVDEDGLPKIVFHNSDSSFTVPSVPWEGPIEWDGLPGLFFADREQPQYGRNKISCFVNLTNPLDMNDGDRNFLHGRSSNQIDAFTKQYEDAIKAGEKEFEFRDDGVLKITPKGMSLLKNDGYFGEHPEDEIGKVVEYAVMSERQVKSADPVTYDDDGNVIPLSRRFDDGDDIRGDVSSGTKDDSSRLDEENDRGDIERKSVITPEEDSEFADLASRIEGLMERNEKIPQEIKELQDKGAKKEISWDDFFKARKELNDELDRNNDSIKKLTKKIEKKFRQAAAKAFPNTKAVGKDGLPLIVFHGTVRPRKDMFTEFSDRPIFAFKREGLAAQYTHSRRDMWVSPDRTGHVIPMVMNLENPLEIDAGKRLWSNIKVDWSDEPVDTEAICKYAKENGHDGVIIHNVRDNMFDNDRASGDEYIAFSSNQVKDCGGIYTMEEGKGLSHDYEVLVSVAGNTKDDSGNVIPLSQRLDRTKKDIRYSISDDGEEFGDSFYGEVYPDRKQSYSSEFGKDDAEDGEKASEAYRENFTKDGKYKSPFEGGKFNRAFLERAREGKGAGTGEVWDDESRAAAEAAGRVLSGMLGGVTFELSDKPYGESSNGDSRKSISGIFTGSGADYNEPSLVKIGSGEGSQVYGWGLYGSNQRGVAQTYADMVSSRHGYTGYSKGGKLIRTNEGTGNVESDAATLLALYGSLEDAKKEAMSFPNGEAILRELEEHGNEYKDEWPHSIIYEQTFFTDREPGDESHLLNWYEPVDPEMLKNIQDKLDENNIDCNLSILETNGYIGEEHKPTGGEVYELISDRIGSPKEASEFLVRIGIDGVKYPVDSYGGKTIKNGDDAGWNYVSFRDDNIKVDHKWVDGEQRFFRNSAGKVVGEYNRATNQITLYPGAKIKDVVHEYSHGLWQFAEQEAKAGRDGLQKKLHQIAHAAPEKVKEAVGRSYYDQDPNVVLEECFTHEMARRSEKNKAFAEAIKTASGKNWYKRAWGAIKDTWKGFASKFGFNKADTSRIDDMTSGEAADYILTQMAQGKKFGNVSGEDDSSTETRMAKESSDSDTYVLPSGRKIPSAQKYLHTDTKGNPHDEMWSVFLEKQTGDGRVSQEFSDVVEGLFSGKDIDADTIKSLPEWKKAMEREKEIQKKLQETHGIDSTVKIQTEERERFRDAIIRAAMSDHISKTVPIEGTDSEFETNEGLKDGESYDVEKGRNICIVIGLPAAGKSTSFANPLAKKFKARLCDSDTIKKVLPEFNNGYGGNLVHEESTMLNEEILNRSIEQGDNIVYPILGYKPEKLENMFKMLRDKGYKINLCLKDMPANIAKGRLLGRFLSKGRYLPIECITKAQGKFADCFERVKGLVDAYVRATSDIDGSNERIIEKKGDLI